jgi:hypothetical protein
VSAGEGTLTAGGASYETATDSDGRATAEYVLGPVGGLDAQRVTATLLETPDDKLINAGFTASAFVPGDPGQTSISGVVLDNQDTPLSGVTIRVAGTTRQAVTTGQGQFKITEAPVGPVHLIADGSTTAADGEYPSLSYNLVTVAGVDNPLSAPIYMVKLNLASSVHAGPTDVAVVLPEYPGFKLEVAKGSVTFPDGSKQGQISVTAVNSSKVPMPPPNGMQPQFIVTIQPTNARFDPPARLTLPNVDGYPPGHQAEMFSYDHDLEEFVAIGLGTVSEDGSVLSSNPGVGVVKAGWHCGTPPSGQGCVSACSLCYQANTSCNCARVYGTADPRLASYDAAGDCREPICDLGGNVISVGDNSDGLSQDVAGDCRGTQCQNGALTTDDNDKPADSCCHSGEILQKRGESLGTYSLDVLDVDPGGLLGLTSPDGPLATKCPHRRQNTNRDYQIDGCSVPAVLAGFGPVFLVPILGPMLPIADARIAEILTSLGTVDRNDPTRSAIQANHTAFPYGQLNRASTAFGVDLTQSPNLGVVTTPTQAGPQACNQHDICYQTCVTNSSDFHAGRLACDNELKRRMDDTCDAAYPTACPSAMPVLECDNYQIQARLCREYAWVYYGVLRAAGYVAAYRQRQEEYCQCCP